MTSLPTPGIPDHDLSVPSLHQVPMGPGGLSNTIPSTVPPALTSILAAQQAAQEKINRELFVGNTPEGTSEMLLLQFLNSAMRRVKLCSPTDSPIIQCRVSAKFAFVECQSKDAANAVLNLNGIPFLGTYLKVSRPSKYTGPHVPAKSWQELTGQPVTPGIVDGSSTSAEEKIKRELFIGNTTPEMTEQMLKDFLGKAMMQVGLTKSPGNPITACRASDKFAFVELRSQEEASLALNLNNIPYMGAMLRVGRPSKYTGEMTSHGNWEGILAKYMSGELKLPSQNDNDKADSKDTPPTMVESQLTTTPPPSTVVALKHMLTADDLQFDEDYQEVLQDTKEECGSFGNLKHAVIPRCGDGVTTIFLEYETVEGARQAIVSLAGRTFDGRKVEATFYDKTKFAIGDYSG